MDTTYYTIKEVAGILKLSSSTVRRAIKNGDLGATRVGSKGQLRVAESTLHLYVTERESGTNDTATRSSNNDTLATKNVESSPRVTTGSVTLRNEESREATQCDDESVGAVIEGEYTNGVSWKIINADVIRGLQLVEDESINCIITSPPYYWQRDYGVDGQIGHEDSIVGFVNALTSCFEEAKRVLTSDGVVFLNLGDTYYSAKGRPHGRDKKHDGRQMAREKLRAVDGPGLGLPRKSLIGIPWRVALAMQANGWTLRSSVIWQRPGSLPEPTAKDRPWRTHEHVFIFTKNPQYWFDRDGLNGDEDIWQIVSRSKNPGAHFAPFPHELVGRCLACGCPPGGTVLDPFAGSGTTMIQALRRGSPAVGIDINSKYCDFIEQQIRSEFDSVHALKGENPLNAPATR